MFKVGDVIVCKKKLNYYLVKDKQYKIDDISYDIVYINTFGFLIKGSYAYNYRFNDYFFTLVEVRKQKLEKINSL